jgi:hypothetical protein
MPANDNAIVLVDFEIDRRDLVRSKLGGQAKVSTR